VINKERMELWIQALEQDRFTKCTGYLRTPDVLDKIRNVTSYRHCALGVGIQVALENGLFSGHPLEHDKSFQSTLFVSSGGFLPIAVQGWYGLDDSNPGVNLDGERWGISVLNDGAIEITNDGIVEGTTEVTFWDIAQLMRATYLKDDVS
jgi:hypothetical protein